MARGKAEPGWCTSLSARAKRLVEIGHQVAHILKPDREPHAVVEDAKLGARLRREPLMRGGGGMGDQALGVAEIVADLEDLRARS